MGEKAVFTLI